jgi:hypothetical protein
VQICTTVTPGLLACLEDSLLELEVFGHFEFLTAAVSKPKGM